MSTEKQEVRARASAESVEGAAEPGLCGVGYGMYTTHTTAGHVWVSKVTTIEVLAVGNTAQQSALVT